MPATKTVWGIDVGQCALKAIKLRYRDNRLQAVSFDVIEHAKILSQPDADEQQLIRAALSKFLSRNNIRGSSVVIAVPGQASFTRFIKLPPVEPRKIPEIVRYEARQQIPFNLDDVVWDYQTLSAGLGGPREVEVGIFAMKRDIVADYVSDFTAMKIEPDTVQMAPVALYNFLRHDKREGSGATVLIDVGAENTNFVVADGDRVWIRLIPLGGNNFTQALCKAFKLPFAKAESLKRHAAESKHARKVFQAMRPVFGDLLTEIQRSIGYYTSLHRDSRIGRVVAMGNSFRLAGLRKFLSQNLGVEVEKIEEFHSLDDDDALKAPLFRENVLSFGVAFGLAIQGCGLATVNTSLLPPEILRQKVLRKKRPWFAVAAACLLGALGVFTYSAVQARAKVEPDPGRVERLSKDANGLQEKIDKRRANFEDHSAELTGEREQLQKLDALVSDNEYAYDLLRTVWDAIPVDERMQEMNPDRRVSHNQLRTVELLEVTMQYVPNVLQYSQALASGLGAEKLTAKVIMELPEPAGPPEGEGAAEAPASDTGEAVAEETAPATPYKLAEGAVPGLLIRMKCITPVVGAEGDAFVNSQLIDPLKNDPRTVRVWYESQNRKGVDPLASLTRYALYGETTDFTEYEGLGGRPGPAVTEAGQPAAAVATENKRSDVWFEAQWLVYLPADYKRLTEEAKQQGTEAPSADLVSE